MAVDPDPGFDRAMLRRAAAFAARGLGRVEPNPYVGAVVVRDREIIGEGAHRDFGGPHAEVAALRRSGAGAHGATLYVTLEPCCHQGKTGPCDRLILRRGIRRVVTAALDPNPRSAGGLRRLARDGVEVARVAVTEARRLIVPFRAHLAGDRPFVVAKWAMTLDGRIASASGDSRYITAEAARRRVHRERVRADAVLVGSGTVLADDPDLTPRLVRGRSPVRVILDRRLRTPLRSRVVLSARETPTWVVTGRRPVAARAHALEAAGVRILRVSGAGNPAQVLRSLRAAGVQRLLLEGGAEVTGAFFRAGLIDRVQAFVAPRLVGGVKAPGPIGGRGLARMAAAWDLAGVSCGRVGPDLWIEGEPIATSWGCRAGILDG